MSKTIERMKSNSAAAADTATATPTTAATAATAATTATAATAAEGPIERAARKVALLMDALGYTREEAQAVARAEMQAEMSAQAAPATPNAPRLKGLTSDTGVPCELAKSRDGLKAIVTRRTAVLKPQSVKIENGKTTVYSESLTLYCPQQISGYGVKPPLWTPGVSASTTPAMIPNCPAMLWAQIAIDAGFDLYIKEDTTDAPAVHYTDPQEWLSVIRAKLEAFAQG